MAYYKPDIKIGSIYIPQNNSTSKSRSGLTGVKNDHDSTWKAGSFPNQALCSSGGVC